VASICHPEFIMPTEISQKNTIGAILAGGQAQRLGYALKANIKIDGTSLLQRTTDAINGECYRLILSTGKHPAKIFSDAIYMALVTDDGLGPGIALANIVKYIQSNSKINSPGTTAEFLMLVAVDTPFFPKNFIQRAKNMFTDEVDAVIAAYDGQTYPTNGLWRLKALQNLPEMLRNGTAPRSLFGLLDKRKWLALDYDKISAKNPFSNINTPADLIVSIERAKTE